MGIPVFGTMAHSFIQAHDDEAIAFERFAAAYPRGTTLLIDTYDTEHAARTVVALAARLKAAGIRVAGVRLDSGDLAALSFSVRRILDDGGLADATIFASGNLDEYRVLELVAAQCPIDGYGIGTSLVTSSDAPALDAVYKLQEYAGKARRKRSAGKATWPGRKQVYRHYGSAGRIEHDVVALEDDPQPGEPLLAPVMQDGRRLQASEKLTSTRNRASDQLARLPERLRSLANADIAYPVEIAPALRRLAARIDAEAEEVPTLSR
jgi:nicotinate phosphoribosyltransferase